jgi:RNA polymerase sigma factor FliA
LASPGTDFIPHTPAAAAPALSRDAYERYLPLVRRVAMRTANGALPPEVGYDEILAAGFRGLSLALGKRLGSSESEFEAYAAYRIRLSVLEFLKLQDPHARRMKEASTRITSAIVDLVRSSGKLPCEADVAGHIGLSLDTYLDLLTQISEAGWVRLEFDGDSHSASNSPMHTDDMIGTLGRIISNLPEQYQVVLGLYYQEQCSHAEIGDILGLGLSRAGQLHAQAVHLVRGQLQGGLSS